MYIEIIVENLFVDIEAEWVKSLTLQSFALDWCAGRVFFLNLLLNFHSGEES